MVRLRVSTLILVLAISGSLIAQERRGPFTAPPRSVRSRSVDQQHIRLELRLNCDQQEIQGRSTLTLIPYAPIRNIELDAAEMQIRSVTVTTPQTAPDPRPLHHETHGAILKIDLDREYRPEETMQLSIEYTVERPRHGAHFVTPDESEPDQPRMVWTQNEPEYAHFWFPCIDSPTDRLTSEIIATVPESFIVLSNGRLVGRENLGDGTNAWHWSQTQTHVPYLMSVVAGDFESLEQEANGIPVISYVPRGRLADAARSFEKTPAMLRFFNQKIGYVYPWPKYAQICVDEYMWGGMEHTSATTLTLRTLHDERAHLDVSSDGLVAHELAHQWFGDLLTCKDWGELWLNESFATYFASLWQEHDEGWDEATWARYGDGEAYRDEDRQYRRSIVNYQYESPEVMFDRHTYPKGGRVLHMLRFVLGDELFWKSIRHYVTTNQHRTVETADLRRAIEDATGQGLNWFFDQWVHQGGHPDFAVTWAWDEDTKTAHLTVKQTQPVDRVTPLFRTPLEIEFGSQRASEVRRVEVSKAEETFHFSLPGRPARVGFDPNDWILKTLKFEKSKEELFDELAYSPFVVPRVRAAEGLEAYDHDDDVLRALARAATQDSFWAVRRAAVKVLARFTGDGAREALIQAARHDPKSAVRREALQQLTKFKHHQTSAALRQVIADDQSYFAVAEALRALVQVDREHCTPDLLAALEVDSHDEVVLHAACAGLAEVKESHSQAKARLAQMLEQPLRPDRRVAVIGALCQLNPDNSQLADRLRKELENDRSSVRTAAINALVEIGDPKSADLLREFRGKQGSPRMIRAVDDALARLRGKEQGVETLRKETETLRQQNRELEQRLKNLEDKLKGS